RDVDERTRFVWGRGLAMRRVLLVVLALAVVIPPVLAQDENAEVDDPGTGVYVTTQDYSALREGPGQAFDRLDIVPPATTLPAIGRTTDAGWIQVRYGNKNGWIAAWLLIWSGDMVSLPADGVNPVSFVRRRGPTVTVSSDMLIYDQRLNGPGE